MPIHTRSQQQRVTYAQSQWRRRRWFLLSPLFDSRPLCHYESCSPYSNGRRCRWALFCGGISIWYDELHTVLSDMYDLHALMFNWLFSLFLKSSFQRFVCFWLQLVAAQITVWDFNVFTVWKLTNKHRSFSVSYLNIELSGVLSWLYYLTGWWPERQKEFTVTCFLISYSPSLWCRNRIMRQIFSKYLLTGILYCICNEHLSKGNVNKTVF